MSQEMKKGYKSKGDDDYFGTCLSMPLFIHLGTGHLTYTVSDPSCNIAKLAQDIQSSIVGYGDQLRSSVPTLGVMDPLTRRLGGAVHSDIDHARTRMRVQRRADAPVLDDDAEVIADDPAPPVYGVGDNTKVARPTPDFLRNIEDQPGHLVNMSVTASQMSQNNFAQSLLSRTVDPLRIPEDTAQNEDRTLVLVFEGNRKRIAILKTRCLVCQQLLDFMVDYYAKQREIIKNTYLWALQDGRDREFLRKLYHAARAGDERDENVYACAQCLSRRNVLRYYSDELLADEAGRKELLRAAPRDPQAFEKWEARQCELNLRFHGMDFKLFNTCCKAQSLHIGTVRNRDIFMILKRLVEQHAERHLMKFWAWFEKVVVREENQDLIVGVLLETVRVSLYALAVLETSRPEGFKFIMTATQEQLKILSYIGDFLNCGNRMSDRSGGNAGHFHNALILNLDHYVNGEARASMYFHGRQKNRRRAEKAARALFRDCADQFMYGLEAVRRKALDKIQIRGGRDYTHLETALPFFRWLFNHTEHTDKPPRAIDNNPLIKALFEVFMWEGDTLSSGLTVRNAGRKAEILSGYLQAENRTFAFFFRGLEGADEDVRELDKDLKGLMDEHVPTLVANLLKSLVTIENTSGFIPLHWRLYDTNPSHAELVQKKITEKTKKDFKKKGGYNFDPGCQNEVLVIPFFSCHTLHEDFGDRLEALSALALEEACAFGKGDTGAWATRIREHYDTGDTAQSIWLGMLSSLCTGENLYAHGCHNVIMEPGYGLDPDCHESCLAKAFYDTCKVFLEADENIRLMRGHIIGRESGQDHRNPVDMRNHYFSLCGQLRRILETEDEPQLREALSVTPGCAKIVQELGLRKDNPQKWEDESWREYVPFWELLRKHYELAAMEIQQVQGAFKHAATTKSGEGVDVVEDVVERMTDIGCALDPVYRENHKRTNAEMLKKQVDATDKRRRKAE